jgi:hypothetical protein
VPTTHAVSQAASLELSDTHFQESPQTLNRPLLGERREHENYIVDTIYVNWFAGLLDTPFAAAVNE